MIHLQDQIGYVSKGLKEEQIKKIPVKLYSKEFVQSISLNKNDDGVDKCGICFDQYDQNQKVSLLSCHHFFHCDCINQWLSHNKVCPLCKEEQVL